MFFSFICGKISFLSCRRLESRLGLSGYAISLPSDSNRCLHIDELSVGTNCAITMPDANKLIDPEA